jgi:hypothetical protein
MFAVVAVVGYSRLKLTAATRFWLFIHHKKTSVCVFVNFVSNVLGVRHLTSTLTLKRRPQLAMFVFSFMALSQNLKLPTNSPCLCVTTCHHMSPHVTSAE